MTPERHAAKIRAAIITLQSEIDDAASAGLTVRINLTEDFRGHSDRKVPILHAAISKDL